MRRTKRQACQNSNVSRNPRGALPPMLLSPMDPKCSCTHYGSAYQVSQLPTEYLHFTFSFEGKLYLGKRCAAPPEVGHLLVVSHDHCSWGRLQYTRALVTGRLPELAMLTSLPPTMTYEANFADFAIGAEEDNEVGPQGPEATKSHCQRGTTAK